MVLIEIPEMPELMEMERLGLLSEDEMADAVCLLLDMMPRTWLHLPLMCKLAEARALLAFNPHSASMH